MRASDHWHKPRAADLVCNLHPKPPRALVKEFSIHTGLSEANARNVLDRLRHLSTCCREPERITLMRLHPGTKQVRKPSEVELHEMDEGKPAPRWLQEQRREPQDLTPDP